MRAGVSIGSVYQYFPNKDAIVLALIGSFEEVLHHAVLRAMQAGSGRPLEHRLKLLVRELVAVHYRRSRLNRVLDESVLQLLRDHKNEVAVPVSGATERVIMAILRALVDLGLASGASPRSTEQRAMHAICGYLLYAG